MSAAREDDDHMQTKKGQTNGEGADAFGAEWYLVSPSGAKVEKDEAASTNEDSASGGYGYGYGYGS